MSEDEFVIPDDVAPGAWRSDTGPVNRLSRIAARMTNVLDEMGPEARDVRCLVILSSDSGGATVVHGYDAVEDPLSAALTDAVTFIDAALKTSARPSQIVIRPL